jgi:aminoglycoside phosphotransferase (APT) family kinase protein
MVAMRMKEGQPVLIKRFLTGTVLQDRPGDKELPQEQRSYMVQVLERTLVIPPDDLEPLPEPDNTLEKFTDEWSAELSRFIVAGNKIVANPADGTAWDDFSSSGSKLGFVVPTKEG